MTNTDTIKRLPRTTLSGQIAEQIRDAILSGTFELGRQLNEVELAEKFGVSRGPLREAMQRLIQEGLLFSAPHKGVFVLKLTPEDFADIEFARQAIEAAALRRIVTSKRLSEIHVSLARVADTMEEAAREQDWNRVVELHLAFHSEVIAAADSFRLSRAHATLQAETRLCIHMLASGYRKNPTLIAEHRSLADSLLKGMDDLEHHLTEVHHHHHLNVHDILGTPTTRGHDAQPNAAA